MSAFDTDPWATAVPAPQPPADEAQAAGPPSGTSTAPSKESTITVNNGPEAKITTTIKFGSGFDAPWAVFPSNTVEEAETTLNGAKNYLELVARVAKFAKTLDPGTPAPAARSAASPAAPARSQASTPPGQQGNACSRAEMTYRTGNGARGPWAGYFCPLQKGDPDLLDAIYQMIQLDESVTTLRAENKRLRDTVEHLRTSNDLRTRIEKRLAKRRALMERLMKARRHEGGWSCTVHWDDLEDVEWLALGVQYGPLRVIYKPKAGDCAA
ncbi:hypothetical protein SAMN05216276_1008177 [Streptosporangium subroseum]|uniref:Uncharacterized protein n=1 Tax=Streptosporangium subroseum TaxID=106412 RepID=A0A239E2E0_9ACTN|nr:hypothetical protein [Streptosporangium subroseum]SNS38551.1 hypothetical protein SAMN05216276_1008177 [Streptosporangium subroseum]